MAPSTNKSIPVPCTSPRHDTSTQPPWRSSLDLVWSYSRSQAFYADNIATSPSFVERHWAGKDVEEGDSSASQSESYDDDDDDDDEASGADHDELLSGARAPRAPRAQQWEGEELPRNAVGARRSAKARPKDETAAQRGASAASRTATARGTSTGSASGSATLLRDPFASVADHDDERGGDRHGGITTNASESTPLFDGVADVGLAPRRRKSYLSVASPRRASATAPDPLVSSISVADVDPSPTWTPGQHGQGSSTFLQSWFNTVNALVGVGMLALPLAFSYAGWVGGMVLFLICGLLTNYTGKVLAHIMTKEPSLRTYADIGSYAFGPKARWLVSLFFCLELWAVSVALIILFGDSMAAIAPHIPAAAWKAVGFGIVLPTVFLPLRWLSPISVVGIISTVTLVLVVVSDGLIKHTPPGSILHPSPTTTMGPQWSRLPLSFGLIMSGFSSHPVIPSLVKDMRDPRQFPRMLNLAYLAATALYLTMGMVGYAMFGREVSDEITRDLAKTAGFPVWLNRGAIWLIVINPLAKFALATRPVQVTFETLLGLDAACVPSSSSSSTRRRRSSTSIKATPPPSSHPGRTKILRILLRTTLTILITLTAILLPGFEKVMAFLGAFLAFTTCVLGPLLANLALFRKNLSRPRILLDLSVLVLSACMAVVGTVWAVLPTV